MQDKRTGESLWSEWSGEGYFPTGLFSVIFFTNDHVPMDNELVSRALASSLQREGIVSSLGEGYRALERAEVCYGYAGSIDGEIYLTVCGQDGLTNYGELVDQVLPITWVEIL